MNTFDIARLLERHHAETRTMFAAVLAKLAELSRQAPSAPAVKLNDCDAAVMAALLPLLWLKWPNGQIFDSSEVAGLAALDPAICEALGPVARPGGSIGKRVGKLLRRCTGAEFAGLLLRREREAQPSPPLYAVVPVSNPPQTLQTDPGP